MAPTLPDLYNLTRAELTAQFAAWGFSPVHAVRLWRYLYWESAGSLDAMPALPAKVRARLAAGDVPGHPAGRAGTALDRRLHPQIPPFPGRPAGDRNGPHAIHGPGDRRA